MMKLYCNNNSSSSQATNVSSALASVLMNSQHQQQQHQQITTSISTPTVTSSSSLLTTTATSITTGGHHSFNATNFTPNYQNQPLAPRFLALSQQQQQSTNNIQTASSSSFRMMPNIGISLSNQQIQKNTSTTSKTTPNILSLSSTNQQQQPQNTNVNITSGNSLQSFIAARGLTNGANNFTQTNSTINNNNNNTNPGSAILNQIKQQQQQQQLQQQQQQTQQKSAVTSNSNLMAGLSSQTSQALSQCILNNTLFVGNLHASLQEIDLIQVFRPFGRIVECCKKWLHFGFVKFSTEEEACNAYMTLNGFRLKGRPMRLEFQNRTKKARIKALIAQAALQKSSSVQDSDDLYGTSSSASSPSSLSSSQSPLNVLLQQQIVKNSQKILSSSSVNTVFNPNATKFMPHIVQAKKVEEKENNDFSFFDTERLLKFATASFDQSILRDSDNDFQQLPNYAEIAWNSFDNNKENIVINDISIGINNTNTIISQANSPTQDDVASSASSSSDSGFRSTLFIGDENQTISYSQSASTTSLLTKQDVLLSRCETPVDSSSSISEHLEFTYSHTTSSETTDSSKLKDFKHAQIQNWNSRVDSACDVAGETTGEDEDDDLRSCITTSDTSDDASIINDDFTNDDTIGIVSTHNIQTKIEEVGEDEDYNSINYQSMHSDHKTTKYTQQLIKDVESLMKKSLDIGIYSCSNTTNSFFVEPEDVLRPLNQEDYNEYQLFPMMEARFVDSYPEFF